ncbi:polyketide cyclase [Arthrobacter sp. SPG23]|uniref:SRPBCC family protein n=1 Tax=Arthrobacter sp. SPG23 TaxID=1610703 RepID=UPI0005BD1078|nr:SRPBCC domain-containing protein [Arthrobacter sp. SPG23]KIS25915.1 polyketide cyclase [Arthrobacter sp. SPG23]
MTVISSTKNLEALSFTLIAEFDADIQRVWQLWEDPRQLERWWGPPTWPATFEQFDFRPGGRAGYYMTGPDGQKSRGWWHITAVDAPKRLAFDDGFADEKGDPVEAMGITRGTVNLEAISDGDRTRMTVQSTFESEGQMQQMVEMGMEEGMKEAVGQIDALLAEHSHA